MLPGERGKLLSFNMQFAVPACNVRMAGESCDFAHLVSPCGVAGAFGAVESFSVDGGGAAFVGGVGCSG